MAENIVTWNTTNLVTIWLMGAIGVVALGFLLKFMRGGSAPAAAS